MVNKRITLQLVFVLCALLSRADKVWIADFIISPGETKTIELLLDNEVAYKSLQCDFELPEGLSIVKNSSNRPEFSSTVRTPTHIIQGSQPSGTGPNHYRVGFITLGNSIAAGSGPIATFKVVAADGFHGTHMIEMTGIRVGDEYNVSHTLDDYTCHITTPLTLADVIEDGEEGLTYRIIDELTCVYVTADGMALYAKDDNGFAHKDEVPYVAAPGQTRYDNFNDFDQSNWVRINLPGKIEVDAYKDKTITGIEGVFNNKTNPEITVAALPEVGDDSPYTPNMYCPANFIAQEEYWFMPPKPQEYVSVQWAVYNDGVFYMPAKSEQHNKYDISGAVACNLDMYDGEKLIDNTAYVLTAIVKAIETPKPAPQYISGENNPKVTEPSTIYEIYPITAETNEIITGVSNVNIVNENNHGQRYNVLGQPVDDNYRGIVIDSNGKKYIAR